MLDRFEFEQDEANEAADQEEMERLNAEVQRLSNRVVLLRATVNRLQKMVPEPEKTDVGEGVDAPAPFVPELVQEPRDDIDNGPLDALQDSKTDPA